MTPERREELRRAEDALITARYNLDRKNYLATIAAQEDRIKALEVLLADAGGHLMGFVFHAGGLKWNEIYIKKCKEIVDKIDAILPATEDNKDGD